jgi:hypothetical protein
MKTLLGCDKLLYKSTPMDRVTIPNKHEMSANQTENLPQESNHLLTCQRIPTGFDAQSNFPSFRRHQQNTKKIETVMVIYASVEGRRLPSP